MKYYKTFKDIRVGDYLYSCNKDINKIYRFQVTKIIKRKSSVEFHFSEIPWDYIVVLPGDLESNKTYSGTFADINSLFDYINENA